MGLEAVRLRALAEDRKWLDRQDEVDEKQRVAYNSCILECTRNIFSQLYLIEAYGSTAQLERAVAQGFQDYERCASSYFKAKQCYVESNEKVDQGYTSVVDLLKQGDTRRTIEGASVAGGSINAGMGYLRDKSTAQKLNAQKDAAFKQQLQAEERWEQRRRDYKRLVTEKPVNLKEVSRTVDSLGGLESNVVKSNTKAADAFCKAKAATNAVTGATALETAGRRFLVGAGATAAVVAGILLLSGDTQKKK